jgi:hypothetical protein
MNAAPAVSSSCLRAKKNAAREKPIPQIATSQTGVFRSRDGPRFSGGFTDADASERMSKLQSAFRKRSLNKGNGSLPNHQRRPRIPLQESAGV